MKTKVFVGESFASVQNEIDAFINHSQNRLISLSHTYTGGKQGFLNHFSFNRIEVIVVYEEKAMKEAID